MGEYEPKDSRNITLKPGHEPGGIERTGPREGDARADSEAKEKADGQEPKAYDAPKQQQGEETPPCRLPEAQQMQQQAKHHAEAAKKGDKGDAPEPSDRGYGADGEERLEKLDREHPQPTD